MVLMVVVVGLDCSQLSTSRSPHPPLAEGNVTVKYLYVTDTLPLHAQWSTNCTRTQNSPPTPARAVTLSAVDGGRSSVLDVEARPSGINLIPPKRESAKGENNLT